MLLITVHPLQTFVPYPVRKLVADPQSHESISELNRMVLMVANTMVCLWAKDFRHSQSRREPKAPMARVASSSFT
jgi:hypothetical protein